MHSQWTLVLPEWLGRKAVESPFSDLCLRITRKIEEKGGVLYQQIWDDEPISISRIYRTPSTPREYTYTKRIDFPDDPETISNDFSPSEITWYSDKSCNVSPDTLIEKFKSVHCGDYGFTLKDESIDITIGLDRKKEGMSQIEIFGTVAHERVIDYVTRLFKLEEDIEFDRISFSPANDSRYRYAPNAREFDFRHDVKNGLSGWETLVNRILDI